MQYAKIDFLIVIISTITLQWYWLTLQFVANVFLISKILETTLAKNPKFLANAIGAKVFQNIHNYKIAKFLTMSSWSVR